MSITTHSPSCIPASWLGRDGTPLSEEEKIRELNGYAEEIRDHMQHLLEQAVQMGVSENFVRIVLSDMVASMERPNKQFSN
jgi:hypothetical protein